MGAREGADARFVGVRDAIGLVVSRGITVVTAPGTGRGPTIGGGGVAVLGGAGGRDGGRTVDDPLGTTVGVGAFAAGGFVPGRCAGGGGGTAMGREPSRATGTGIGLDPSPATLPGTAGGRAGGGGLVRTPGRCGGGVLPRGSSSDTRLQDRTKSGR